MARLFYTLRVKLMMCCLLSELDYCCPFVLLPEYDAIKFIRVCVCTQSHTWPRKWILILTKLLVVKY